MICFQLLVSLVFWTTVYYFSVSNRVVICFQLLVSCTNNSRARDKSSGDVVICFQLLVSLVFCNNLPETMTYFLPVVICFQLLVSLVFWTTTCFYVKGDTVVICFQLLVSLVFWTTSGKIYIAEDTLWFAFNYWYLWYSEQLQAVE